VKPCVHLICGNVRGRGSVGREDRRNGVWIDDPDFSVGVVGEGRRAIDAGNFAGPDDFRVVDVGGVVNPFAVRPMSRRAAHDDQMFAGSVIELSDEFGALPVINRLRHMRSPGLARLSRMQDGIMKRAATTITRVQPMPMGRPANFQRRK